MFEKIDDWIYEKVIKKYPLLEDYYYGFFHLKRQFNELYIDNPKHFFINIWKYKTLLFTDRWYDFWFLLNFIKVKLEQDVKKYKKYGISLSTPKLIEQMERCIYLIDNLQKDDYIEKELDEPVTYDDIMDFIHKKKQYHKPLLPSDEDFNFKQACKRGREKREKDNKELFDIISKNIFSWWD